jgi:RNA polymerase sigma-70 factor (ECF subfamily)
MAAQNAARLFAHHEAVALARRGLAVLQTLPGAWSSRPLRHLSVRPTPLLPGFQPFPGHTHQAAEHQRRQKHQQQREPRIAAHPLERPFHRPGRPGHDRFAGLETPQVIGQRQGTRVARPRSLHQALQADRLQVAGYIRLQEPRGRRLVFPHQFEGVQGVDPEEWWAASEHDVEQGTQRVDVGGGASRAVPLGLLRRQELGRSRRQAAQRFNGGRQPQASGGTDAFVRLQGVADATPDVPDDAEAESEVDGLRRRALDLLRTEFQERIWQMFWLTFVDERSPVDVAAEMGVTPAAVRKAKSRVLHRLKEEFTELIQ